MGDIVSKMDNSIEGRKSQGRIRHSSQNIAVLLYPDADGHARALAKIISKWDYTYILHDKDVFNEDYSDHHLHGVSNDELGEEDRELLKKPHYHVLIHLPNLKEPTQVAKELMIEQRFVQRVSSRDSMLVYLVHTGLHDKYQYNLSEVHSNRPTLIREALAKYTTDSERLLKVISIIQNKNCLSLTFAMTMLANEGFGSFAIRNASLIDKLVSENIATNRLGFIPRNIPLDPPPKFKKYESDVILDDVL